MTSPTRAALLWIRKAIAAVDKTHGEYLGSDQVDYQTRALWKAVRDIDECAHQALAEDSVKLLWSTGNFCMSFRSVEGLPDDAWALRSARPKTVSFAKIRERFGDEVAFQAAGLTVGLYLQHFEAGNLSKWTEIRRIADDVFELHEVVVPTIRVPDASSSSLDSPPRLS